MMFSTMPELPEVETLCRELKKALVGRVIKSGKVFWPGTVMPLTPTTFLRQLKNQKIKKVERRAKILLLSLHPSELTLAIHLKMTGQLIYCPQGSTLKPAKVKPLIIGGHPQPLPQELSFGELKDSPFHYTRLVLNFNNGDQLYFNDLRKFGWLHLLNPRIVATLHQYHGLEPLSPDLTPQSFCAILDRYPKRKIKALLLDQTLIAGLGNIYADESCFAARIKPGRRVATLVNREKIKLHRAIRSILTLAIKHGGTSTRDYRKSDGSRGGFAVYLQVYGRGGQPCSRCHKPIQKIKLAGRGTHFCAKCQK